MHAEILKLPNEEFYENELEYEAKGTTNSFYFLYTLFSIIVIILTMQFILGNFEWFIGTDLLLNKDFPIIFESVKGNCIKSGTSSANVDEVDIVVNYVKRILKQTWNGNNILSNNIGIVSPYSKQCQLLKKV